MRNYLLTVASLTACLPLCISCRTNEAKLAPQSDGQVVHRSKSGETTVITLLDTLNATNRTELPGGTQLFYFTFEGHQGGKDFYTVGIRYPLGRPNEVAVTRQVAYGGKRVEVSLGEDDTVVIEPRKGAK